SFPRVTPCIPRRAPMSRRWDGPAWTSRSAWSRWPKFWRRSCAPPTRRAPRPARRAARPGFADRTPPACYNPCRIATALRPSMTRTVPVTLLGLLLGSILAVPCRGDRSAAWAAGDTQDQAPAAPYDGSVNVPPDGVSSFVVRNYKTREKRLWKGLLQVLQQSGYPPEDVDEKQLRVKTSFVDFKAMNYSEEVGEPPPLVGPNYHILQMNRVRAGKVSLEGVVTPGEGGGAVLSLRARILVGGLDQVKRIQVLADR